MGKLYKAVVISILLPLFISGQCLALSLSSTRVRTDTTDFDGNLSSDDDTLQKALDTLDDMATGGSGSGSMTTAKEGGVQVGGADIVTLDFGAGFDLTEDPDTEINITLDFSEVAGHDLFTDFVANEHLDWTSDQGATNIDTGNYPITDTEVPDDITIDLAATVTTNANLTGDVTSTGNATDITESVLGVGGTDTIFPADPDADKYLMWDDDPGQLSWEDAAGGGGAPTDADYLVGTANGDLSAEIVVGTAPGGELGGTWASPTIDDLFLKLGGDTTTGDYDFTAGNLATTGTITAEQLTSTDDITMAGYLLNTMGATDTQGMFIDGDTNPLTSDPGSNRFFDFTRTVGQIDTEGVSAYGLRAHLIVNNVVSGSSAPNDTINRGMENRVLIDADDDYQPLIGLSSTEKNYGLYNVAQRLGTITSSTNTRKYYTYGSFSSVSDSANFDNSGHTLTTTSYGNYSQVVLGGIETDGTINRTAYGWYLELMTNFNPTNGSSTAYGVYLDLNSVARGTIWGFYNNIDTAHNFLGKDNVKSYFGAAQDASITYDGTDMVINPKEVGSGILDVLGTLQTDGYNAADGSAGISTTFTDNDGNTITVKDGLITAKTAP